MIDLFEEELLKPKKKKTKIKTSTILLVAIALLSILCVATLVLIVYIKSTILTITIDGIESDSLKDIFIIEENNKVYIPIRRMGEYLNYETHNGDYIVLSEDPTKCYIKTEEELVSFTLDSNVLTKVINGQTQQIKVAEPIKEINGELCITSEGAKDAFNFKFYYDVAKKDMIIETLPYLYNGYSQAYQAEGYLPIEPETFKNKTAILDDMLIVKANNNCYGVITVYGETLLETKYDNIEYLRETSDFLVESNGKKGIISKEKETKVALSYDSIQKVTNKNDIFYVVGKSNLYGLFDVEGKPIIYPEYERIGIDVNAYTQNGVTNGYILYNSLVPVRINNKWGLIDITTGNKVANFVYDSFGCPNGKNNLARTYGVLNVSDYNLIVVNQGGKYNLMDVEGKWLFDGFILDSVYITTSEGKKTYYITIGNKDTELIGFLEKNKYEKPTPIN